LTARLAIRVTKVRGPVTFTATYRETQTAEVYNNRSDVLTMALAVGGVAQLAAAHCPNERILDPQ